MLRRFLGGGLRPTDFEAWFLDFHRRCPEAFDASYRAYQPLFEAVDSYVSDATLRSGAWEETEEALRGAAALALFRLEATNASYSARETA